MLCSVLALGLTSCSDDEWGNDNSEMENVYYFGFQDWGQFKNDVKYDVTQGSTVNVPVQFWCEFNRSYDVVTYYYIKTTLVKGQDYDVVDENGASLQPDANGAYSMTWKNALKGVKNIGIKALNGSKGSLVVQTYDPVNGTKPVNTDVATTVQSTTSQYEVRIFSQNYMVTVNVK